MARIVGVAVRGGKFLGFVDSKGKVRKAKFKRIPNPHFRGRYVSVSKLGYYQLSGKSRKQLLAMKRKQEHYADQLDKSMDGWDKVDPQYENQKISAMKVLRKDRDQVEENIRSINQYL